MLFLRRAVVFWVPFAALTPRINPRLLLPFSGSAWGDETAPDEAPIRRFTGGSFFPPQTPAASHPLWRGGEWRDDARKVAHFRTTLHCNGFVHPFSPFFEVTPSFRRRQAAPLATPPTTTIVDLGGGVARGAPPWRPGPLPHDSALASELE